MTNEKKMNNSFEKAPHQQVFFFWSNTKLAGVCECFLWRFLPVQRDAFQNKSFVRNHNHLRALASISPRPSSANRPPSDRMGNIPIPNWHPEWMLARRFAAGARRHRRRPRSSHDRTTRASDHRGWFSSPITSPIQDTRKSQWIAIVQYRIVGLDRLPLWLAFLLVAPTAVARTSGGKNTACKESSFRFGREKKTNKQTKIYFLQKDEVALRASSEYLFLEALWATFFFSLTGGDSQRAAWSSTTLSECSFAQQRTHVFLGGRLLQKPCKWAQIDRRRKWTTCTRGSTAPLWRCLCDVTGTRPDARSAERSRRQR